MCIYVKKSHSRNDRGVTLRFKDFRPKAKGVSIRQRSATTNNTMRIIERQQDIMPKLPLRSSDRLHIEGNGSSLLINRWWSRSH